MITWHIELDGKAIELNRVDCSVIREQVDPIKDRLGTLLSGLEMEAEELKVLFVVDEEGYVSIFLRGSSVIVQSARDQIGDERRLGVRMN
jgi:hypothetical protein